MPFPVSKPSLTGVERDALMNTFDSGQLTQGDTVARFERRFARITTSRHAIAVPSGTAALHLIMASLLNPGDEVLVPDLSFIATANAVAYTGAVPVLCDIDAATWAISLEDAEKRVTRNTRAIVVVHLYGQPADMSAVTRFASKHGLEIIEDAAEALGASYDGVPLGSWSRAGAFSFFGNKVITTGEGGMITTDDSTLDRVIRVLRGQGQDPNRRYYHPVMGFNYRMTEMQAAIGVAQLSRLPELLEKRRAIVDEYRKRFEGYACISAAAAPWLFTFLTPPWVSRNYLQASLAKSGIDTRTMFVPMHEMPMYLRSADDFPIATDFGARGLSLPTYPDLSLADVGYIARRTLKTMNSLAARNRH